MTFIVIIIFVIWLMVLHSKINSLEKKVQSQSSVSYGPPAQAPVGQSASIPSGVAWSNEHARGSILAAQASPVPASFSRASAVSESDSQETEIATNWLTKIGVLALLFGMAFFLKYAIDRGWISQWTRIILGMAVGGLLIALGELWKEKYAKYASMLVGGGIALLYFCIFAAYQFYSLVPQMVAFILMLAVTVIAIVMAFRHKSQALGIVGVCGAFLSPILLHSGADQQVKLFLYLSILNIATVVVLARYFWLELATLSLIGTIVDYGLWFMNYSNTGNVWTSVVFVAVTFAIFIIVGAWLFRKHSSSLPENGDKNFGLFSVVGGVFYFIAMWFLLGMQFHSYLPIVGLLGSLMAFIAYVIIDRLNFDQSNYALSLVGAALLFASAYWQYSGKTFDLVILALGLFGVAIGVLVNRAELRILGVGKLIIALLLILFAAYDMSEYTFILNSKFGLVLAATGALLIAAWLYSLITPKESERNAKEILSASGWLLLWLGFSVEIYTYFRTAGSENARNLYLSLWWILYATFLMVVGAFSKNALMRKVSIGLFMFSVLKVFLYDVQNLDLGYRVVSFIVLGVILLMVSFAYNHNKEKITHFLEGEKEGIKPNA